MTEEEGQRVAKAERRIGSHALEGGHSLSLIIIVLSHDIIVRLGGLHHKGVRIAHITQALAHGIGVKQLLELPYNEIIGLELVRHAVARGDEYTLDACGHGIAADN